MIVLNSGIGLILFGTPVLLIILTLLVSLIETFFLKKYNLSFRSRFKQLIIANFISTFLGILFVILLNVSEGMKSIASFIIDILRFEKFGTIYLIVISLVIAIPNYVVTAAIELITLRKIMAKSLTLKDILAANLVSYFVLLLIWIIFLIYT